jgi:hypothetical protein
VEAADQRGHDVAVLGMEVVPRPIEVGGHHAAIVGAILPVVALAQLDPGDLGDRIGLVRGFENAGQQRILAHGLGHCARIDARGAQKQQLRDPWAKA